MDGQRDEEGRALGRHSAINTNCDGKLAATSKVVAKFEV